MPLECRCTRVHRHSTVGSCVRNFPPPRKTLIYRVILLNSSSIVWVVKHHPHHAWFTYNLPEINNRDMWDLFSRGGDTKRVSANKNTFIQRFKDFRAKQKNTQSQSPLGAVGRYVLVDPGHIHHSVLVSSMVSQNHALTAPKIPRVIMPKIQRRILSIGHHYTLAS